MKISEKYLKALKTINDWALVSEWAIKVGEIYPDILEKADTEAVNQLRDTTGINEIAARISFNISRGAYDESIEIDSSERPRKVRYVSKEDLELKVQHDVEEDVEPLKRAEIIKLHFSNLTDFEKYRITEFESIAQTFKKYFYLDLEVDHAIALLNNTEQGKHHPENLQLLLKTHNNKKSSKNWDRFSIEDQIKYLEIAIAQQESVADKFGLNMDTSLASKLFDRLKEIY